MESKTKYSVIIVTGLLGIYTLFASLPFSFGIVFLFFVLTSGSFLWMVLTILKDTSNLSGKTFDDHFYEDIDHGDL